MPHQKKLHVFCISQSEIHRFQSSQASRHACAILPEDRNFLTPLQVTGKFKKARQTMVSMTAPCHTKKKDLAFCIPIGNTSIPLTQSFAPCMRHPSWRWQLSDTTSSYRKFQKRIEKTLLQWPHHATAKKNYWCLISRLKIHRFHSKPLRFCAGVKRKVQKPV